MNDIPIGLVSKRRRTLLCQPVSNHLMFETQSTNVATVAITLPITVTLCAMVGVFVTTATTERYGTTQWNPVLLLISIQQTTYTPLVRCGTFFAGCAIVSSQTFVNLTQNTIPYGMDLTGMFPRYLTRKRACMILVALTMIAQPWRFLSQAYIFITILSVFARKHLFLNRKIMY